jgi:hypothetical protein
MQTQFAGVFYSGGHGGRTWFGVKCMYMPGRNFEDTNTHLMDISITKLVPQHYSVTNSWYSPPSGLAFAGTAYGSGVMVPASIIINTSHYGDGIQYILPYAIPGISQSITLNLLSLSSPFDYSVSITQGGTSLLAHAALNYAINTYNFTPLPSSYGSVVLEITDVVSPPPGTTSTSFVTPNF